MVSSRLKKSMVIIASSACVGVVSVPLGLMAGGYETVEASTAGKTREQALGWARSQQGKGQDFDGFAGVQCTDLIQMYANALGQKLPAVGASKYITATLPSGWKRYNNKTKPQAGDIFIYEGGQYGAFSAGHVGLILQVDANGYECLEYNWAGSTVATKRYVNGIHSFSYVIRPDFPTSRISNGKAVSVAAGHYILNSATGNRFLSVQGASKANWANVRMWSPTGKGGQVFRIVRNSNNNGYNLINKNSGKYLNTETHTPGRHNVIQYTGNGGNGQQWLFDDAGNGYVYIRNFFNYYLDVNGGVNADGTNVGVVEYLGGAPQKWKLTKVSGIEKTKIPAGDYIIESKIGGKVLDVAGASKASGANIGIYTKNETAAQIFTIGWDNNLGCNYIYNKASGKYIDTRSSSGEEMYNNTGNAVQYNKTMSKTQTWFFEDAGDGYYYIRNLWGYYLDVAYGKNADGTNVNVWSFDGANKQKWKLVKYNGRTGVYYENNRWVYLKNGVHDTGFTGIAKSSKGNLIFVKNGVFDKTFTGVAKSTDGKWLYVKEGRFDAGFTGVAKSTDGRWLYVKEGRFDAGFTGVAKSTKENWIFVRNGVFDPEFTGVAISTKGNWIYVREGRFVSDFTGIAKSTKGNSLYVINGRWANNFTGKYKNYNIKNGYVL